MGAERQVGGQVGGQRQFGGREGHTGARKQNEQKTNIKFKFNL